MTLRGIIPLCCSILIGSNASSQKTDTLVKRLDSLHRKMDSSGKQVNNINQAMYNEKTRITFRAYLVLLGTDFTQEVTGPFHSSARTWAKVGVFGLLEGGLFFLDRPVQKEATQLMERNAKFRGVSHYVTNFGADYEVYTLGALGLYGWVFRNEKLRTTTLLATQSYMVGAAMETLVKMLASRQRPNYIEPGYKEPRPMFRGPRFNASLSITSSFPSGHTTVAFAAATVFAMEYHDRPLVPVISYSAATLIGISRITENAHWVSDVLAGAALGYVTGRQVTNNYHRYAFLKNHQGLKNRLSFTLHYNYDHLEPALLLALR